MRDSLDLNEVATFARVVDAGSFSAAAAELGVPKSTVSRRVARLEERLGVRLLQRSTRRMHATTEGERFHARIAGALQTLGEAGTEVREGNSHPRGLLRLTAPMDFGHFVLGGLTARFLEAHPEVNADVVLTNRFVDLVGEGFDMAVRAGSLEDSSLVARRIGSADCLLFASPAYLAAAGTPERPEQLARHRAILFRAGAERTRWPLEGPAGEEVEVEVRGALDTDDLSFVTAAAIAGGGIGLVPSFHVTDCLSDGRLVRVLPGWRRRGGGLHVVYPSARHLAPKVRAFRDFLLDELRVPGADVSRTKRPEARPPAANTNAHA